MIEKFKITVESQSLLAFDVWFSTFAISDRQIAFWADGV
jgi:hypothetical protein